MPPRPGALVVSTPGVRRGTPDTRIVYTLATEKVPGYCLLMTTTSTATAAQITAAREAAEAFLACYANKILTGSENNIQHTLNRWTAHGTSLGATVATGHGWEGFAKAAAKFLDATYVTAWR